MRLAQTLLLLVLLLPELVLAGLAWRRAVTALL